MEEAQTIADELGIHMRLPVKKRLEGAEKVGEHRPSTLQDVEAGNRLELDAVIGVLVELARFTGIPVPYTETVHALVCLLDETLLKTGSACTLVSRNNEPDIPVPGNYEAPSLVKKTSLN